MTNLAFALSHQLILFATLPLLFSAPSTFALTLFFEGTTLPPNV